MAGACTGRDRGANMRAAVVDTGTFSVCEVDDPTPGPDDLILEVSACGICGSDIKTAPFLPAGTIMGHEFSGTVVAAGSEVAARWQIGTPATAMPVSGCGTCLSCVCGDVARCTRVEAFGLGGRAGGFAEYIRVSARETVRFDGAPTAVGAVTEPLAVGLHAVARGAIKPGHRVLIVGAGPVGIAILLWAVRQGVDEIVVSDPVASRRTSAVLYGASSVVDPTADHPGEGFDVVFECVGSRGMIAACLESVAPRGRIVVAGVCLEEDGFMPVAGVVKDIDMSFVSYYTRQEFTLAAKLLQHSRIDVSDFITGRGGLDDLGRLITELGSPSNQQKVLIEPQQVLVG